MGRNAGTRGLGDSGTWGEMHRERRNGPTAERQEQRDGDGATHWSEADPEELLAEYRALPDLPAGAIGEQQQRWKDGIPSDTLEQNKSRINGALRKALGRMAEPYLIQACGLVPRNRRRERIGLKLAPEVIAFAPIPPSDVPEIT